LKQRAKTLVELSENALFYVERPAYPLKVEKAAKLLGGDGAAIVHGVAEKFAELEEWNAETTEMVVREYAQAREIGLGKVAQPLRAALTGSNVSPGVFEVMEVLGRDESLARLRAAPAS
jgi:glutamyl-tRNA synthetase